MKKITLLLTMMLISACSNDSVFTSVKKDTNQFNYLSLSSSEESFVHVASIKSSTIEDKVLQATGMTKSNNSVFVSYNTAGEPVRGGLDILSVSDLGSPVLVKSMVSEDSEYAEIKYYSNHVFMVGQARGQEKNDAVLTVVNVSDTSSPKTVAQMRFEDGWYATSIDIQGNIAYISVPNIGLKIVDISKPNDIKLIKTEYMQFEEKSPEANSPSLAGDSAPEGFTLRHVINSSWATGYSYQIQFNNNRSVKIDTWELCFEFALPVSGVNNADVSSASGNGKYKFVPKSYNHIIYPGQTNSMSWNGNVPLNGNTIKNVKLVVNGESDCLASSEPTPQFDNSLFVRRLNNKSLVLGGDKSTKIISHENGIVSLVADLSSEVSEAPSRFIIHGNRVISNAAFSGLTLIDKAHSSPEKVHHQPLRGTGNGLAMDAANKKLYLAQGNAGLIVMDMKDKDDPKDIGEFDYADDAGSANNVLHAKISGKDYVFISDGLSGLKIVEIRKK